MRKAVAVLLMIVFCFACAVSPAEEFGELTFQGIPWFSSPEEAVLHLFETGFMNSELTGNKITELYQIQPVLSGSFIGADPADENVPYTFQSGKITPVTSKLQRLKIPPAKLAQTIAGQTPSWLHLDFTAEPEKPRLVECCFSFKSGDYDEKAVYDALVQAYGEPDAVKDRNRISIWLGDNNTIIVFRKKDLIFASLDGLTLAENVGLSGKETADTGL